MQQLALVTQLEILRYVCITKIKKFTLMDTLY